MDAIDLTAWSTVILTIITFVYASLTYLTLKEQKRAVKITALEKKLEKVYSPFEDALTTFNLELSDDPSGYPSEFFLPEYINTKFYEFGEKLIEVRKNYGYLIDSDIIRKHRNMWDIPKYAYIISYEQKERNKYEKLIEVFHRDILAKKHKYQIEIRTNDLLIII